MTDETQGKDTPAPLTPSPAEFNPGGHEPDLDNERDARCGPVAQGMLEDLAADLIPEDANVEVSLQPVLLKVLKRSLDANLNLTTDNPYIFQILIGVLGGLKKAIVECKPQTAIDEVRFGRISRKMLEIVAKANLHLLNATPEETIADYAPIKAQLQALFDEEKLSWVEIQYVTGNIFDSFRMLQDLFNSNIEKALERAEAKAMGVADMGELTMQKLDAFLKEQ